MRHRGLAMRRMDQQTDLLDAVVSALQSRRGDLPEVAKQAGMSYDTVLRIKARENDPGYSKVKRLAVTLGLCPQVRDAA